MSVEIVCVVICFLLRQLLRFDLTSAVVCEMSVGESGVGVYARKQFTGAFCHTLLAQNFSAVVF